MRIIAGKWGGRRLPESVGAAVRPTTDRVREALASLLSARDLIEGACVLDLFAGTGACGLELLSRGASALLSVDRDVRAAQRNGRALAAQEARVLRVDLLAHPQSAASRIEGALPRPATLVIADPPYDEVAQLAALLKALSPCCSADATLVVEQRAADPVPALDAWMQERSYRYGDTALGLFLRTDRSDPREAP